MQERCKYDLQRLFGQPLWVLAHVLGNGRPHLSRHLIDQLLREAKGLVSLVELANNDAHQGVGYKVIAALVRNACFSR